MRQIVAVVGLSGVGKSTFVRALREQVALLHLQASDLIKSAQARRQLNVSTSEELRLGPVAANQQLLIDGFNNAIEGAVGLVVFDGHTVIFGSPITEIPSSVFSALGCSCIIVIEATPSAIRSRRLGDVDRIRPDVSEEDIAAQQRHATKVAIIIADELRVPVHIMAAEQIDAAVEIVTSAAIKNLGGR